MSPIKKTLTYNADFIRRYHHRTKHHLARYAIGPTDIDWEQQPNLFRHFGGCKTTLLPLASVDFGPAFSDLACNTARPAESLAFASLGQMLSLSLAISAWKRYGSARWPLRCNPSSGNLHPTEAYLALPHLQGIGAGVYHYDVEHHALEHRCPFHEDLAQRFKDALPANSCLIGFSSVPWREAWKYGERAWRYCQLDLGHALGALQYSAALFGWSLVPLDHWADKDLSGLLGLDRSGDFQPNEPEYPELVCLLTRDNAAEQLLLHLEPGLLEDIRTASWHGRANCLDSHHHYHWPIIDQAVNAAEKPQTARQTAGLQEPPTAPLQCRETIAAVDLLLRRRSAQAFDGTSRIPQNQFVRLLDHTLARPGLPPWGLRPAPIRIHFILFVHRVDGLSPGVYVLTRDREILPSLRNALRDDLSWEIPEGLPEHLHLFRLVAADAQQAAAQLACHQQIASHGVFSVAMLGEFDRALQNGPWGYRTLLREAGLVGQALYLEAESLGLQGTGIGCFFDDALHDLLGIKDETFQVVYQFTVGKAVVDNRITTETPYPDR